MKANLKIQQEDHNVVALDEAYRIISSASKPVAEMVKNGDEMKSLMPSILSLSNTSSNWDSAVKEYWDSIFVKIDDMGKPLEVGFVYDYSDVTKRNNIDKAVKEIKEFANVKDDESLMKLLKSTDKDGKSVIPENTKYLYATPIEIADYLLYRYCLVYSLVANNIADVDKSPRIAFYLYSKGEIENTRKKQSQLEDKAMQKYMNLIADKTNIDNVLLVLDEDIKGVDEDDKHMILKRIYKENPNKFIEAVDDKLLIMKAEIKKLINAGIFNVLSNSEIIVDADNPELVIGKNISEAISFFNLDTKKAKVAEYRLKYKSLK
jgi:hypothetical protein